MELRKHLAPLLAAAALIFPAWPALAQPAAGGQPYSPTAPANCCIYAPPTPQGQNVHGMHVYLWAGLKSHGVGEHDYPQWLADWSKILTAHGAVVDGSLHPPSAGELAWADVVVIFKGDAGFMTPAEHAALEAYVKRGGGLVSFHDSLCGPDPADFAQFVGGGKRHGQVNYTLAATLRYHIADPASPIVAGMPSNFEIYDEAFFGMTWAPAGVHPLVTVTIPDTPAAERGGGVGKTVPQMWTYEHTVPGGEPARAFVWMQGHTYTDFANPVIEPVLLRGIAWAAKRPYDELTAYKPPPRRRPR